MRSFDKAPSLFRAYSRHFLIGAAITPRMTEDPAYAALLRRHFNSITAENIMKPQLILDRAGTVALGDGIRTAQNFEAADRMLAFAKQNGIYVRFHTLVWHNQTPRWFFAENWSDAEDAPLVSAQAMLLRQEAYIRDVMTHVNTAFPGVVYCWDVVNEAIEPDHGAPGCYRTKSLWYQTVGEEFVPAAFRAARRYQAPGQKLFYNDFNCYQDKKLPPLLALLKKLKAEDLVDGMGMQGHLQMDWPDLADCEKAARAYGELGLTLQTTELDIHCPDSGEEKQAALAERYAQYFDRMLRLREEGIDYNCATFWGVTDRDSWLTGFRREGSWPLLFTGEKETKPAFDAVLNAPQKRERFRIDQAGYAVGLPKPAAVLTEETVLLETEDGEELRRWEGLQLKFDRAAGENVALIDLGDLREGKYYLCCGEIRREVRVEKQPWQAAADALVKGLYYQRCGCGLEEKHAGVYAHGACHTEPAKEWEHPEKLRRVTGGWHDAGDYGKYTGPGAVAAAHLIYTQLFFPRGCGENLNIPESGNGVPDILNEARWELEWLLKMQREDGAFHHKLTKDHFAPFIMPEEDREQEYLMPVSTCATAAACACCALGAVTWQERDAAFAGSLRFAAERAWAWLEEHPDCAPFRNPEGVRTGQYGDMSDTDERFWAACELYAMTGEKHLLERAEELYGRIVNDPDPNEQGKPHVRVANLTQYGWADVTGLGAVCCLFRLGEAAGSLYTDIRERFLRESEKALELVKASGYGTALSPEMYIWGSTLPLMNHAMTMILNWVLTGREDMRDGALCQLHCALGLNPLDLSLITGFGQKRVMHPHHRPSGADGIEEPVPGLISGGPNARWNYGLTKEILTEDTAPAKFFLDEMPSADTNEIAIYWNSPAAFVFACFAQLTKDSAR